MTQQQDRPPGPVDQFGGPVNRFGTSVLPPGHPASQPVVAPWSGPPGTDGVSVAGFVLSLLFWPVGLVLSGVGMRRTRGGLPGRGLAVAGLVISLVQLALVPVLAAVAIPVFLNQRDRALEAGLRSDLASAAMSMEVAATELGAYPSTLPPVSTAAPGTDSVELVAVTPQSYCLRAVGGDTVLYRDEAGVESRTPCG